MVSLPDANLRSRGAREAGVLSSTSISFFPKPPAMPTSSLPVRLWKRMRARRPMLRVASFIIARSFLLPAAHAKTGRSSARSPSRLGKAISSTTHRPHEIFDELRVASKGGVSDYYGITWERIERENGLFWPCPTADHPGTPRLYEDKKFKHPDGKAHFNPVEWRPSAEMPDEEYPIILTTGRVVSHFLSGTQTRRIGALIDQYPATVVRDASATCRNLASSMTIM